MDKKRYDFVEEMDIAINKLDSDYKSNYCLITDKNGFKALCKLNNFMFIRDVIRERYSGLYRGINVFIDDDAPNNKVFLIPLK